MPDIQHYERIIKKVRGTLFLRIFFIFIYSLICAFWIGLALRFGLVLLVFAPLFVFIAYTFTWQYVNTEYEYSLVAGTFSFSKIYGGRRRKNFFEADLKFLVSVVPYSEALIKKGETVINAIPDGQAVNPCVCLFEDGGGKKYRVIIDCDAMTFKILKFFKPSAIDRRVAEKI